MSNGGDKMLTQAIDRGIAETEKTPGNPSGLCGSHEGIRIGVNALLLCKKDELEHPRAALPAKSFKVGKFEVRGYGSTDLTKILLAIVIIVLLASDKLPKLWKADVAAEREAAPMARIAP